MLHFMSTTNLQNMSFRLRLKVVEPDFGFSKKVTKCNIKNTFLYYGNLVQNNCTLRNSINLTHIAKTKTLLCSKDKSHHPLMVKDSSKIIGIHFSMKKLAF